MFGRKKKKEGEKPEEYKFEELNQNEIDFIIDTLEKDLKCCLICENQSWNILSLMSCITCGEKNDLVITSRVIPTIGFICKKCGFITQHSAFTVGISGNDGKRIQKEYKKREEKKDEPVGEDKGSK